MSLKVQNGSQSPPGIFSRWLQNQFSHTRLHLPFHLVFFLGLSGNFYHVTSIKMLHMAIKTINKHFMSLSIALRRLAGSVAALTRCKTAEGGKFAESGAAGRPFEKSATIMAANQKGVAMNGEDDGCHEASRCGELREREFIKFVAARPVRLRVLAVRRLKLLLVLVQPRRVHLSCQSRCS